MTVDCSVGFLAVFPEFPVEILFSNVELTEIFPHTDMDGEPRFSLLQRLCIPREMWESPSKEFFLSVMYNEIICPTELDRYFIQSC